jgi:multidrug transporter EmrE-like cation transporter
MHWIYLLIAAILETAWTYSIKFLTFKDVLTLRLHNFYTPQGMAVFLPFLGYIIFGIGNIYFFSMAMKIIPVSIAFAIWTATTLVLMKVIDRLYFQQSISWSEMFFTILIIIGIIGLKTGLSK